MLEFLCYCELPNSRIAIDVDKGHASCFSSDLEAGTG